MAVWLYGDDDQIMVGSYNPSMALDTDTSKELGTQ